MTEGNQSSEAGTAGSLPAESSAPPASFGPNNPSSDSTGDSGVVVQATSVSRTPPEHLRRIFSRGPRDSRVRNEGPKGPHGTPKLPHAYSTKTFQQRAGSFERQAVDHFGHKHSGWLHTLFLAYSTIGTIYGDLGTSPLYTVSSILNQLDNPVAMDYLGVASCIFWTITLVPLIKYCFIVLFADDLGEGGTFALYSNLCRHARISLMGSRVTSEVKEQLARDFSQNHAGARATQDSARSDPEKGDTSNTPLPGIREGKAQDFAADAASPGAEGAGPAPKRTGLAALLPRGSSRAVAGVLERSWSLRQMVLLLALLGTCGVLSDGVLTPSISVLSAVGGLEVAHVALSQGAIVGISCAILVVLFSIQQFGTDKISFVFSPVILLWLLFIAGIGIYNIACFDPTVFKAISPYYAIQFFTRNGFSSWVALGDIVLCITGGEAMFADMGHFSRESIQLSFSLLVYPCVLLSYLGQISFILHSPAAVENAFYESIPRPLFWPVFAIASLAAIVASQALITGAFSIIKQSMTLSCFPRSTIVHTSLEHEGQIYIPSVNWALMLLTVAVTAGFRSSDAVGNAYGVTVVMVMLLTTALVSMVMLVTWDLSPLIVLPFYLFYTGLEGVFFSSTLFKVPNGGWFPLVMSAILLFIMYTWHFGTYKKKHFARAHAKDEGVLLGLLKAASPIDGAAIVYSEIEDGMPPVLVHYLANVPAIHKVVVALTVKQLPVPKLDSAHRLFVARMKHQGEAIPGFYRAVAFYGYTELWDHGAEFLEELRCHVAGCASIGHHHSVEGSRAPSMASAWDRSLSRDTQGSARTGETEGIADDAYPIPGDELDRTDSAVNAAAANAARAGTLGALGSLGVPGSSVTWDAWASAVVSNEEEAVALCWQYNQVYFMGRSTTVPDSKAKVSTKFFIPVYTTLRALFTSTASVYRVPEDKLIEVGMVYRVQ